MKIPLKVKDKNGWKILKAEVPAGLNLKPGLGADVAVQLLAGKVLQQRLLHSKRQPRRCTAIARSAQRTDAERGGRDVGGALPLTSAGRSPPPLQTIRTWRVPCAQLADDCVRVLASSGGGAAGC